MMPHDMVLTVSGKVALACLGAIYSQSLIRGDLFVNPDWTISNVMVQPYNASVTHYVLFPSFLTMCMCYARKKSGSKDALRVAMGSIVAIIGGIGMIAFPVTTHELEHVFFAFVTFTSSAFWYPQCTPSQFRTFAVSSLFFIGGFCCEPATRDAVSAAVAHGLNMNFGTSDREVVSGQGRLFVPSACCMAGELGILITWGQMVQGAKVSGLRNR